MSGAVFSDIEGTLVSGNTPRYFIKKARELGIIKTGPLIVAGFLMVLAKPLPKPRSATVQFLALRLLLKGKSQAEIDRAVEATIPGLLEKIKPATLARLRQYQAEGKPVFLVSAALHNAVARLAQEFDGSGEGTKIEITNGTCTGRAGSPPCQGEEKASRVKSLASRNGLDLGQSIGFGDTVSDIAFLSLVGRAIVVDPTPAMQAEAERRGWEILVNTL